MSVGYSELYWLGDAQKMTKKYTKTLAALLLSFGSGSAFAAQAPTLKINGFTIITAASVKQQRSDNGKGGTPTHIGMGASDLYFTVTGRSEGGTEYKYRVNFEAIPGSSAYVNKNYVEFNGGYGTTQFGMLKGTEDTMRMDALSIAGGANAIDGSLNGVYNMSAGVIDGVNPIASTNKSAKAVWYSPTVSGFQVGVAYTPNTSFWGRGDKTNHRPGENLGIGNSSAILPIKGSQPYGKNNMSIGLKYLDSSGLWTYGASAVMIRESTHMVVPGSQQRIPVRNGRSYMLGAQVGYDQLRVVGGFIDNGKSRLPKNQTTLGSGSSAVDLGNTHLGDSGKAYNVGGQWTTGAYQLAVSYYDTNRKTDATGKAKSNMIVTSLDYSALQGLKFFTEVDFIRSKTNDSTKAISQTYLNTKGNGDKAIGDNAGTVMVIGTKLSF